MTNDNVVMFRQALEDAKSCEVTKADILSEHELMISNLMWNNVSMDFESEAKLIKHERALEKFGNNKQAA